MKPILIVEDNKISGSMIHKKISAAVDDPVLVANNLSEAIALLDEYDNNFFAAFLDYVLPDAPNGEVIDEVIKRGISSIVFTSTVTNKVREKLWGQGIVDYVIKDSAQSVNYLTFILSRLRKNLHIKVLVVDDSSVFRTVIKRLLSVQNFDVLEAVDGKEALSIIKQNSDIKIIVTDHEMPNVDGFTLTRKLRQKYSRNRLAIFGVTSDSNKMSGARFIKSGANDFINKNNFIIEEFYCRINFSLENMEKIEIIKNIATTDDLTGLYNRKYFYETAGKLFASAKRSMRPMAFAIIDIDHFKDINDSHGHLVGDQALKHITQIIKTKLQRQSDLIGRFGGEEFVALIDNIQSHEAFTLFDSLRKDIEDSALELEDKTVINITVSIGVYAADSKEMNDYIKGADQLLYQAKNAGRNLVMLNTDIKSS